MSRYNKKHTKLLIILGIAVTGMFGFAFALVPIYNTLCSALGINGKTANQPVVYNAAKVHVDHTRQLNVEFIATINGSTPWKFYPKVSKIQVEPGKIAKLAFYAENQTDHRMTVQAIPSVSPAIAAKYIKKTECFCFTQQTLNGHEAMDMPLLFHVDADLPKEIKTITLSYTLFDVTSRKIN